MEEKALYSPFSQKEVKKMKRNPDIRPFYLTIEDRKKIEFWYNKDERSVPYIAKHLNVAASTIYQELYRGATANGYSAEEAEIYRRAAKKDPRIYRYELEEKDLLYFSWGNLKKSAGEIAEAVKEELKAEQKKLSDVKDLVIYQDLKETAKPLGATKLKKENWDKRKSFRELLALYYAKLPREEQEEISLALRDGLKEAQLKSLLFLPGERMKSFRLACRYQNKKS